MDTVISFFQVLELPVKTERDLDGIMNLVFEKAITEPAFSVTYAALCQKLAKVCKYKYWASTTDISYDKILTRGLLSAQHLPIRYHHINILVLYIVIVPLANKRHHELKVSTIFSCVTCIESKVALSHIFIITLVFR